MSTIDCMISSTQEEGIALRADDVVDSRPNNSNKRDRCDILTTDTKQFYARIKCGNRDSVDSKNLNVGALGKFLSQPHGLIVVLVVEPIL